MLRLDGPELAVGHPVRFNERGGIRFERCVVTQETEFNFEEAMQRLEEIVEAFDSGEMTLRQMEASFIEGMNLIKQCSACLDEVELRVNELSGPEQETPPVDENPAP